MRPGGWSWWQVTITYDHRLPPVRTRVPAASEQSAKDQAVLDATSKGWPREYLTITAVKEQL